MLFVPTLIYLVLIQFPAPAESLRLYLFERVFTRIESDPTVDHHFAIFLELAQQLLPSVLIVILITLLRIGRPQLNPPALFCLLIGFAGIVPLSFTLVQRGFYLVPALPFIALALAISLAPVGLQLNNWLMKRPRWNSVLEKAGVIAIAFVVAITILLSGQPKRDIEKLKEVKTIASLIGQDAVLPASSEVFWNDWSLKAYLVRKHFIQLNHPPTNEHDNYYYLQFLYESIPEGATEVNISLQKYRLLMINPSEN